MKKKSLFLTVITVVLFISSCKKEPAPVNEEEVITTMTLSLQKQGTSDIVNFSFNDPDGDGGISAAVDSIIIEKAATYQATITILNNLNSPPDTISNEILEEGADHQFFYLCTPGNILSGFIYQGENDINGNPIGLDFRFDTWNSVGTGTLRITLRHQPDKYAAGVLTGNITNAGGETDAEVDFPVRLY